MASIEVTADMTERVITQFSSEEPAQSIEEVKAMTEQLAFMLSEAKGNVVLFTGAGLSTAAGIADFRGPSGIWTQLLIEKHQTLTQQSIQKKAMKKKTIRLDQLQPTTAHMAIVALANAGFIRGVISQNVDGLHMKSGLSHLSPYSTDDVVSECRLIELHGNCFIESCWDCSLEYIRDFDTCDDSQAFPGRCAECTGGLRTMCHCTPRRCLQCGNSSKILW